MLKNALGKITQPLETVTADSTTILDDSSIAPR